MMTPRISPIKDAMHHVISQTDKTSKLEVKYINAVKGRGIFAKTSIYKEEFVVEYRGERITEDEAERRRRVYHPDCAAFMFAFKWQGKTWCIDASREDGSLGRLINDDHKQPNCRMKKITVNGKPHLCLFALNEIKKGEEITYDYGGTDCPWRTQPSTTASVEQTQMDSSLPLPHSGSQRPNGGPEDERPSKQPSTTASVEQTQMDSSLPLPHSGSQRPNGGPEDERPSKQPSTTASVEQTQMDSSLPLPHSGSQWPNGGPEDERPSKQPSTTASVEQTQLDSSLPLPHSGSQRPNGGPEDERPSKQPSTTASVEQTQMDSSLPLPHSGSQRPNGCPEDERPSKQPSTTASVEQTQMDSSLPLPHSGSQRPNGGPEDERPSKQPSTTASVEQTQMDSSLPLPHSGSQRPNGCPEDERPSKQPSTTASVEQTQMDSSLPLPHSGSQRPNGGPEDERPSKQPSTTASVEQTQMDSSLPLPHSGSQRPNGCPEDERPSKQPSTTASVEQTQMDSSLPLPHSGSQRPNGCPEDERPSKQPSTTASVEQTQMDSSLPLPHSGSQRPNGGPEDERPSKQPSTTASVEQTQMDSSLPLPHSGSQRPNGGPEDERPSKQPSTTASVEQTQMDSSLPLPHSGSQRPNGGPEDERPSKQPSTTASVEQTQMDSSLPLPHSGSQRPNGGPEDERPSKQSFTQFPDENETIPRLRRTKSVAIKYVDLEDSGDLFDSASGSGEEYVPDSSDESDIGSGELNTQPTDSHKDWPAQFLPSETLMECDSTSDNHKVISHNDSYDKTSSTEGIVVGTSKKNEGKRVYDKRHYCLYCCQPYAKMARHLQRSHEDKIDVAKALSFPKGSKERKKHLNFIRNKGNFAHNASVMESGDGVLVPFKRPKEEMKGKEFMHCAYCQGLFTRKVLWRHMRRCALRPESARLKPGKNRVQSLCTYVGAVPSNISKDLWKTISAMTPDPITDIIKDDSVIVELGQHLLNKGGTSPRNQQCVREKMREMGRLMYNARKYTSLKKMEDLIDPKNYMEMVEAVQLTCGFDSKTNKYKIPSLANKLGNSLVKVSKLLKAQGLMLNNSELVRKATEFQTVHQEKWNELISATALRNIREAKWNVPTLMPFTQDVQKLHAHLNQIQDECCSSLSESPSTKAWTELTKASLAQIILFNRRREGEVASMPLEVFLSRDTSHQHQDVDWALTEVEKKLCQHFSRIVTRGKRGRPVPILLTPKMLSSLELLVKLREACGVPKDNLYLFARTEAMTHFRGSDCLRTFAKACGAKSSRSLTSTKLRKHAATLSTVLNMTDTEMDQLANFLGHDIRIHREFYRLPEKTLQLAKISKVLMALENGRLAEFHGKNLDEIQIDPEENILNLDEEDDDNENDDNEDHNNSAVEGNSSAIEPSAVQILQDRDKATIPPPSKKRKPPPSSSSDDDQEEIPLQVSTKRASSRGKAPVKRSPWTPEEVQAVERHLKTFIKSFTVPGKFISFIIW
ncbi:uncharacterized protein LOC121634460 [Melanotaenia boesemani]|uniref:uncharacterized protein LOC121634460 n=1 Tax=Melanotaenia boesemani TaxID=1250792 RepID=UPI001C056180|nr:uncharacterized protein LOC121634460 [Melanotaenia boesemani]